MNDTYVPCTRCHAVNRVRFDASKAGAPVCAKCKSQLPLKGAVVEVTAQGLASLIAKSPLPVVVDFWADWCGPCKAFAPTFAQVSQALQGQVVFAKLDTQAHQAAAAQFQIRGIPALLMFRGGKEIARQAGAMPAPMFEEWLRSHL